ncbi:DUF2779 domain-containing protein [archaeon]|jgi:hypothetical protein|nr:DUF2779 domain-containing protein [archaeon]MBT4351849.1 DUF2779 domain-containing protein [archaeon]MBT4647620.1 DUF2779 domain-containing protein [archaeon]MBT6822596.1 DUF2779 domain-containing protein [archaeon]MBT7392781.1 DUF2779 domain-containing protein [archaeon]
MSLTKSSFITGLQCHKLLWYSKNKREVFPKRSKIDELKFNQGSEIGQLAKKVFSDGIDITELNHDIALQKTSDNINLKKPIFEAAFNFEDYFIRIDILEPNDDSWDIIEVKSSTSVKEQHIDDVAFQKYVAINAGIKIKKCYVMHINNQYIKTGEIEPIKLFSKTDVTDKVNERIIEIKNEISIMQTAISNDCPDIKIGPHCNKPYSCSLKKDICWKFLPKNNVMTLTRVGKKGFEMIDSNILDIKDITGIKLSEKQRIQQETIINDKPHINYEKLKEFIDDIKYPIYFLDFEAMNPAVPLYDGTKPYQHIPFQYSLHIQENENSKLTHHSLVALDDPRENIILGLKKLLGETGTILAYNKSFEIGRLNDLAGWYPKYKEWVDEINKRFIDLIVPFRKFYFYDSKQMGSSSIKYVLPALVDLNYSELEIGDGFTAIAEYVKLIDDNTNDLEKEKIINNLEEYCKLDTFAMVKIYEKLKNIIS